MKKLLMLIGMLSLLYNTISTAEELNPTVKNGAEVFRNHCLQCHSLSAVEREGDSKMAKNLSATPPLKYLTRHPKRIREAILFGGKRGLLSPAKPAFGDQLNWLDIESVIGFVQFYHKDAEQAIQLLSDTVGAPIAK